MGSEPKDKIKLPEAVTDVIKLINQKGFEAFVVGGCIRDFLRGEDTDDFDLCTNARPVQIQQIFKKFPQQDLGAKHGTIRVKSKDLWLEITTYRQDGIYTDGRHPDEVKFVSQIEADLARRDFTMNTVAYHPVKGFVDPYSGIEAIANKRIEAVGEAELRFSEDALRILRALRFMGRLDFSIASTTAAAMLKQAPLLKKIAVERQSSELNQMLLTPAAAKVLQGYLNLLREVFPALFASQDQMSWDKAIKYFSELSMILEIRLTFLFGLQKFSRQNITAAKKVKFSKIISQAEQFFLEFKYSTATRKKVIQLLNFLALDFPLDKISLKQNLRNLGIENFRQGLDLQAMFASIEEDQNLAAVITATRIEIDRICTAKEAILLSDLAIAGKDLLALGFIEGPEIASCLEQLLEACYLNPSLNQKNILLQQAEKFLK